MENVIRFWNFIFFCLYFAQLNFHKVIRYINPIFYLEKSRPVKKFFAEKRGIENIADYVDKSVFYNANNGIPLRWANIHIGNISVLLEILLFNIFQALIKWNVYDQILDKPKYLILAGAAFILPMTIANYLVLSKNKIYLTYFQIFNQIPEKRKYLCCLLILAGYAALVISVIFSFTFLK